MPVTSIATTGRLSAICAQPPSACCFLRAAAVAASSWMKKVVAEEGHEDDARRRARKVARMPISGGSAPPISGPTRLPAMMPEDRTPSAQPDRAFGVCVATSTVEPDE